MDLALHHVRVLVTAASQGLGRACAGALCAEGARVFICSRDEERVAAAAADIGAVGSMACDLRQGADITAVVREAVEVLGGLDVLVVNSGPPPARTFAESDDNVWTVAFDLILLSAMRLARAAIPHLTRSGRGRIVTITGYGIREPKSELVASEATRAAVSVAAKALSTDLAPAGVTVNNIAPGPILTDRLLALQQTAATAAGIDLDEQLRRYTEEIPVRRLGTADEVGALCAFLCSGQAGFLTGQTIVMDGGINRAV